MSVLFCVACSSDSVIEEIKEIDTTGTDLMRFTRATEVKSSSTRAGENLKTGFMVSTYKAFGNTSAQQTVMDKYKVDHNTTGSDWDGNTEDFWDYVGVNDQKEKYWDYSNSPYRFNAIAPYPVNITGFVLSDNALTINAAYKAQKVVDGTPLNIDGTDVAAEPYLAAQVQRGTDWKDIDIFANSDQSVNNQSQTKDRYIALPFHHLNSKIRFGVYSLNPWATENKLYIKDLTISATADTKFVTGAGKYEASGTGSWKLATGNSGFKDLTTATDATTKTTLFSFSGFDASNNLLEDNDLRKHQGQTSAYFLQCKDGFVQIPQEGVQMYVSLKLMQEDNTEAFKTYTNVPVVLTLEDNSTQYKFNWVSGNIYTYYLILDFDQKLEIQFTATLAPWEDISGSLSTDLEK